MTARVLYAAFDVVPSPKGASRHITYFTRALVEAGHQVTLMTAGLAGMPAEEQYAGARILRVVSEEPNFLRRAMQFGDAVWEHLRKQKGAYNLVHFRDIWSGRSALDARRAFGYGYRTLFEANGLPSVELKYHYPALGETILPDKLQGEESALLREVDGVVCVSAVTAIYLRSLGAPPEAIRVIPNGVEPARFQPVAGRQVAPGRLVYAGTLASWQGVGTLIRALPVILAAFPDTRLDLVGPSKKRHQKGLSKLVAKIGLEEDSVRFVGAVEPDAVAGVLAEAAVCLAPLTYNDRNVTQGCCPIKLLEYAAAARPIVAADLPVVRELLHAGEALFYPAGDPVALARRVIRVLSDPAAAQAMAERAAARVRESFTWERAGDRLLDTYRHMLGDAAPGREPARRPAPAPP